MIYKHYISFLSLFLLISCAEEQFDSLQQDNFACQLTYAEDFEQIKYNDEGLILSYQKIYNINNKEGMMLSTFEYFDNGKLNKVNYEFIGQSYGEGIFVYPESGGMKSVRITHDGSVLENEYQFDGAGNLVQYKVFKDGTLKTQTNYTFNWQDILVEVLSVNPEGKPEYREVTNPVGVIKSPESILFHRGARFDPFIGFPFPVAMGEVGTKKEYFYKGDQDSLSFDSSISTVEIVTNQSGYPINISYLFNGVLRFAAKYSMDNCKF